MKWENKGHEFDDIGYLLKEKKFIYLYGAGGNATEIISLIGMARKWLDWEIRLIDKDVYKQKNGWQGYSVMSPEEFFTGNNENYFIVICPETKAGDEIYDLLVEHNIDKKIIFKGFYFLYTYLPVYFAYVKDMVFFTSQNLLPSTVCNLNCRDCLNFTPYIKKHVTDTLEDLKKDVDLFFGAVDLIYRFQITGGEPLLYKNLKELLEYIDQNYREKILRFEMVTNGTIIPNDDICSFLSEKKIYVFLDDYRMSLDDGAEKYRKVYDKFIEFNVDFCDNHVDKWIRMYPLENEREQQREVDLINMFDTCGNPWSTLRAGKISACNYAMYAEKAGICDGLTDEYYDLAQFVPEKKKELVEFRVRYNQRGYVNFCKKCAGWTSINQSWCEPAIQV